ncbi:hypothetical protein Peur_067792 [Populus x canadensis]
MSPRDYERFLPFLFMDVRSMACVRVRERERWGKESHHSIILVLRVGSCKILSVEMRIV